MRWSTGSCSNSGMDSSPDSQTIWCNPTTWFMYSGRNRPVRWLRADGRFGNGLDRSLRGIERFSPIPAGPRRPGDCGWSRPFCPRNAPSPSSPWRTRDGAGAGDPEARRLLRRATSVVPVAKEQSETAPRNKKAVGDAFFAEYRQPAPQVVVYLGQIVIEGIGDPRPRQGPICACRMKSHVSSSGSSPCRTIFEERRSCVPPPIQPGLVRPHPVNRCTCLEVDARLR